MSLLPEDRVGVRKRMTRKTSDGYVTAEIWIERARPSGVAIGDLVVDIQAEVDGGLDRFSKESKGNESPAFAPAAPTASIPSSTPASPSPDPRALDLLPWTNFNNGKGAWIYSDTPSAKQLVSLLNQRQDKTLIVGIYKYRISGANQQFVNRFVHNGGSAKR